MKALHLTLIFLVALWSTALNAQAEKYEQLFAQGNEAYIAEKYDEAITYFQTILGEGVHSPELYLNLGNAYLKNKNIAASILYYERGLVIDPTNERILNNLSFAENQRLDKIEALPAPLDERIVNGFFSVIPLKIWAILSVAFGALGLLFYLLFKLRSRMLWGRSAIVLFIVSFALFFLVHKGKSLLDQDQSAVVFEPRVLVLTEPKPEAPVIFELHEGTKVQVLGSFQDFTEIRLANGQTGWLKDRDLRRIKLSY
ncbi:MAG: hypothetical protein RLZZ242_836 [Bacteroidota bacterium]|jgi:tetratricopeptide (TPR) repeat protein